MKVDEWLAFFKKHNEKKLFSLSDLSQLTAENKPSLSVQLSRLVKAGVISKAAHEWYENPFSPPSAEEVAMVIRFPSYLSMEYALSKHGVLSQTVHTITLITTKLPYTYKTSNGVYEYHQISKSLFWGYKKEGTVLIGEPEKAFLDFVYIRCVSNNEIKINNLASLINDMDIHEFDLKKLHRYAKRFSSATRKILSQLKI